MKTLESLFLDELADMYDAENRLGRALPKWAKAARHDGLRQVFQAHLTETGDQAEALCRVFEAFGRSPRGRKCEAMVGLLKEAEKLVSSNKGFPTIDAALIFAAQKAEHYEIASYGGLRDWAIHLGNAVAADLLQEILNEEKAADQVLTELARECCNAEAAQEFPEEVRRGAVRSRARSIRPERIRIQTT